MLLRTIAVFPLLLLTPIVSAEAQIDTPSDSDDPGAQVSLPSVGQIDAEFLLNYYDQDGDHSPVTGGEGTEDLQVAAPLFVISWQATEKWRLVGDLGVDQITSASTDNIDDVVSSASERDLRSYTRATAIRSFENQQVGFSFRFSNEYDYRSLMGGLSWNRDFNDRHTNLSAYLNHYEDLVDLYDIDGEKQGTDDRQTTDFGLGLTQVLGRSTVGSVELTLTQQSGFLSTPFHEVILAPTIAFPDGERVAERLPDSRTRSALGLRLNHAFTPGITQRVYYRYYTDDWDIDAHTVELETHFRLPTANEMWLYPILRFHTQSAAKYWAPPRTFTDADAYYTADGDLRDFDAEKLGLGWRWNRFGAPAGWGRIRFVEVRLTSYSRSDGLESIQSSFGLGWSIR